MFQSPAFNPIVISFRDENISDMGIVSTEYSNLLLFVIRFTTNDTTNGVIKALPIVPSSCSIALPLRTNTTSYENFVQILAKWKTACNSLNIPFHKPTDEMDDETNLNIELKKQFEFGCDLIMNKKPSDSLFTTLSVPGVNNIQSSWTNKSAKGPISLNLYVGIPGSDLAKITASICSLTQSSVSWYPVAVVADGTSAELESAIRNGITKAVKAINGIAKHQYRPRIMLSVLGHTVVVGSGK